MVGRNKHIPNVSEKPERKSLRIDLSPALWRLFTTRSRERKMPQAAYLQHLLELDAPAPLMSDAEYKDAMRESEERLQALMEENK